jgi:ABC-type sugar transport system ATPase subunit
VSAPAKHLEIWNVSKSYPAPQGEAVIVRDFSLSLAEGEFVSIIGHSGCGKSTVLSILAGLDQATYGGVVIDGREVTGPGAERAIVFQAPCLLPWLNARENVQVAATQGVVRRTRGETKDAARHYLDLVLKFSAFYYAATGALLSFYLSRHDHHLLKYALIFLGLMSLMLAGFFMYAGHRQRFARKIVVRLAGQLGMDNWPEVRVLTVLLFVSAALLVLVSIGVGVLFFRAPGGSFMIAAICAPSCTQWRRSRHTWPISSSAPGPSFWPGVLP